MIPVMPAPVFPIMTTARPASARRTAASLLLLALSVSGCSVTTTRSNCENAQCRITLSGVGADTEIDQLGVTLEITAIGGGSVTLDVFGEAGGPDEQVELFEGGTGGAL
jgi:hypothetical protein